MNIVWAPEAVEDLEAAIDYLAERNPQAANKLSLAALQLVERLGSEPIDGPEHELHTGETVRGWPLPPFRIYYQRSTDTLRVLRVYHQKREPIGR